MKANNAMTVTDDDGNEDAPFIFSSLISTNEDNHKAYVEDVKALSDSKCERKMTNPKDSLQMKVHKKPNKSSPCPRCASTNTKFCYYNNRSPNQPRHFCKDCRQFWTLGGAIRNVPVRAGRRKSKYYASHYTHIMRPSDGLQCVQRETLDLAQQMTLSHGPCASIRSLNGNGTILVQSETPLCLSPAHIIKEHNRKGDVSSQLHGENSEELSDALSATVSTRNSISIKQNLTEDDCTAIKPLLHLPSYPVASCTYPWSFGWTNVTPVVAGSISLESVHKPENVYPTSPWSTPNTVGTSSFCPPPPVPYMPVPFYGSVSNWPNEICGVSYIGLDNGMFLSSSTSNNGSSEFGSSILGKRYKDESTEAEEREKYLWAPKAGRMDDINEATRSSILASLGINAEERTFKAFRCDAQDEAQRSDAPQILQTNPGAIVSFSIL